MVPRKRLIHPNEIAHGVQLLHFHLDVEYDCSMLCCDFSIYFCHATMYLSIDFLLGTMLVHNKFVDSHAIDLMIFVSPSGVDGEIHQL